MQALIYWKHGKELEGNYLYKQRTLGKKITDKDIDLMRVQIADHVCELHGIQADAKGIIIKNIMSL